MREPITLQWLQDELPQLIENGDEFDATSLYQRKLGRAEDEKAIALLKLIAEYESRKQYCSPASTSRSHVHAILKSDTAFKKLKLNTEDTKRIVNQCQRAKWLEFMDYRSIDRKPHQRWTLTAEGRLFSGLPALPAPTTQDGASMNMAQGGAPTAPTYIGGMGDRARAPDGANEVNHK